MTETIEETENVLLGVHDDLVRVMGNAYMQELVDADDTKGIRGSLQINVSLPIFGAHAAKVFRLVQDFII